MDRVVKSQQDALLVPIYNQLRKQSHSLMQVANEIHDCLRVTKTVTARSANPSIWHQCKITIRLSDLVRSRSKINGRPLKVGKLNSEYY
jgi:hypothetical protein